MDNLQEMLDKQKALQERLGYNFEAMDVEAITAFIKEFSIHINQELNELLYELPFFKPWKDYRNMPQERMLVGMHQARLEYIDMIHFVLNVGLALGFDSHLMYTMYMEKNAENHIRQDEGYTHDKSYR